MTLKPISKQPASIARAREAALAKTDKVYALDLRPKAAQAEKLLKAMSCGHRLLILCELLNSERSVTSLQLACGLSQSSLSQHLARLRKDAVVKTRRESQTIYYSLADDNVSAVITLLYQLFCAEKSQSAPTSKPARDGASKPRGKGHRLSRA